MIEVPLEQLLEHAEGDTAITGWIVGQLLAGVDIGEALATIKTARMNLDPLRARFEAREKDYGWAAAHALNICLLLNGFPVPEWAADCVVKAVALRANGEHKSIDAGLASKPLAKNSARRIKKESLFSGFIWQWVNDRLEGNPSLRRKDLFAEVAIEINEMVDRNQMVDTSGRPLRVKPGSVAVMYDAMQRLTDSAPRRKRRAAPDPES